jgi:hypothetical protein
MSVGQRGAFFNLIDCLAAARQRSRTGDAHVDLEAQAEEDDAEFGGTGVVVGREAAGSV